MFSVLVISGEEVVTVVNDNFDYDFINTVSCNTNSMGLTMNCNDRLFVSMVDEGGELYLGRIYVYNDGNKSIVHRLVVCVDSDCNVSINFKKALISGALLTKEQ